MVDLHNTKNKLKFLNAPKLEFKENVVDGMKSNKNDRNDTHSNYNSIENAFISETAYFYNFKDLDVLINDKYTLSSTPNHCNRPYNLAELIYKSHTSFNINLKKMINFNFILV